MDGRVDVINVHSPLQKGRLAQTLEGKRMLAARVYTSEAELREDVRAIQIELPVGSPKGLEVFHRADLRLLIAITPVESWRVVHRRYPEGGLSEELSIMLKDPWHGMD